MSTLTNAIYLNQTVADPTLIKQSLTPSTVVVSDLNNLPTGILRLGLMFENDILRSLPFMIDDEGTKGVYKWYSNNFVTYLKKLKANGINEIDLITCDLNNITFIKETSEVSLATGINIEYSLNQTGNGQNADWIMESNNENLINVFFTNNILTWNHVLNTTIFNTSGSILALFNTMTANSLTYSSGKYTLNSDVTMTAYLGYSSYHIQLNNKEVFDGNGHSITLNFGYGSTGFFYINSSSMKTQIENLTMNNTNYGIANNDVGGGGIVQSFSSYFTVKNCINNSPAESSAYLGGICGGFCRNFVIEKCTNNGDFSNCLYGCGGICGSRCFNFKIKCCKNYGNFGTIETNYDNCGGICGSHCGNGTVEYCHNHGNLYGHNTLHYNDGTRGNGGIVGGFFGESDFSQSYNLSPNPKSYIIKCKNYGLIYGGGGGICGASLGYVYLNTLNGNKSYIEIKDCVNYGSLQSDSAGICSTGCGYFDVSISNDEYFKYTLKAGSVIVFKNCYTHNGSLLGFYTGSYVATNYSNVKNEGSEILIKDSFTKDKVPLVDSFTNENVSKITYIKGSKKINLLKNQKYQAVN